jgi:hypothetical protein
MRTALAFLPESDILKIHTEPITMSPRHWAACSLPITLQWDYVHFTASEKRNVPADYGGVYTFVAEPGIADHPYCSYLFYVGKAERQSFRERYDQYLGYKRNLRSKWYHITRMLNYWDGYLWFCYARIDNVSLIPTIEKSLQDAYVPPFNKEFRGEVGPAVRALR